MVQNFPILLAEDEPVSRKLLEVSLTKAGYNVVSVANGRIAVDKFTENFFPIIVTDWEMPEMDGPQMVRIIRQTSTQGYVYIIMLTSRDSKADTVSGLESGADDYLTKPFNPPELLARLKTGIRILNLERSLKKANEEIHYLSITDPLTGCYNRGYLTEHIQHEINRVKRYNRPFALIICDIDFFKKINDRYGHQAGDEVLKAFVNSINKNIRHQVDWMVRYGGEEFVIVLPETDCKGVTTTAERIRTNIEKMVVPIEGEELRITASFGGTCINKKTSSEKVNIEAVLKRADDLLYHSKSTGRNKVTIDKL
jgi:two-component system, cell cycle response regulator